MLETFTSFFIVSIVLCIGLVLILTATVGLIKIIMSIPNWVYIKTKSDTVAGITALTVFIIGVSAIVASIVTIITALKG